MPTGVLKMHQDDGALMASWLKDLEFRNVQVPLPLSQLQHAQRVAGEWGQVCGDIEIFFFTERE